MKAIREVNGYRVIYKPEHPSSMTSSNWEGYVYEHIYVVESTLGKLLSEEEVIHHLDGNKANNRFANLLVLSRSSHAKLHQWLDSGAYRCESSIRKGMNSGKAKVIEPKYCENCGSSLQDKQKRFCSVTCKGVITRKIQRPSKLELEELLKDFSMVSLGKRFGVSDNAIRKWAKQYELLS